MRLNEAIDQLDEIRAQMLRSELGPAFHTVPTAATGLLAVGLGAWQVLVEPPRSGEAFAWSWLGLAVVAATLCGLDLVWRSTRATSDERRRTRLALVQLSPPLGVGVVLTGALLAEQATHLLPGTWALLFALALVSARPYLSRAFSAVAAFYALAGLGLLVFGVLDSTPRPLGMALVFGIGQLWSAALLRAEDEARREARS